MVGEVFNIGGGSRITVNDTIGIIERICGKKAKKKYIEKQKGDVIHTAADISKARTVLGYDPKFNVEKGIANEAAWLRDNLER